MTTSAKKHGIRNVHEDVLETVRDLKADVEVTVKGLRQKVDDLYTSCETELKRIINQFLRAKLNQLELEAKQLLTEKVSELEAEFKKSIRKLEKRRDELDAHEKEIRHAFPPSSTSSILSKNEIVKKIDRDITDIKKKCNVEMQFTFCQHAVEYIDACTALGEIRFVPATDANPFDRYIPWMCAGKIVSKLKEDEQEKVMSEVKAAIKDQQFPGGTPRRSPSKNGDGDERVLNSFTPVSKVSDKDPKLPAIGWKPEISDVSEKAFGNSTSRSSSDSLVSSDQRRGMSDLYAGRTNTRFNRADSPLHAFNLGERNPSLPPYNKRSSMRAPEISDERAGGHRNGDTSVRLDDFERHKHGHQDSYSLRHKKRHHQSDDDLRAMKLHFRDLSDEDNTSDPEGSAIDVKRRKKKRIKFLTYSGKLRFPPGGKTRAIYGLDFLDAGQRLITDRNNRLLFFDKDNKVFSHDLKGIPYDVCALSDGRIAVTLNQYLEKLLRVYYIGHYDLYKVGTDIQINCPCNIHCICFRNKRLCMACPKELKFFIVHGLKLIEVDTVTLRDTDLKSLSETRYDVATDDHGREFYYIQSDLAQVVCGVIEESSFVSKDTWTRRWVFSRSDVIPNGIATFGGKVYVSNQRRDSILELTNDGEVLRQITHSKLREPGRLGIDRVTNTVVVVQERRDGGPGSLKEVEVVVFSF